MATYTEYPTSWDVEGKLKSAAFWPTGDDDSLRVKLAREQAGVGVRSATRKWEELTGWNPFLQRSSEPTPRPFRIKDDSGVLSLRSAAQEVASISSGGRVLLPGVDFDLGDAVDITGEPPYTHIYLRTSPGGIITVTATWGWCAEVPHDAWEQIEQVGALGALTSIENLQSIGSISMASFSKAFDTTGIITQQNLLQVWAKDFLKSVNVYKRVIA